MGKRKTGNIAAEPTTKSNADDHDFALSKSILLSSRKKRTDSS